MSRISIKITDKDTIRSQIGGYVTQLIFPEIVSRAFPILRERIPNIFIKVLRQTPIWQAIEGDTGRDRDVSAHLGLTEDDIENLKSSLLQIIRENIQISTLKSRGVSGRFTTKSLAKSFTFTITVPNLEEEVINSPYASYTSKNGYLIPWVNWLINGGSVQGLGFIYLRDDSKLSKYSRSGRGLMLVSRKYPNWSTSQYGIFAQGNFIEETINSPQWNDYIEDAISLIIADYF